MRIALRLPLRSSFATSSMVWLATGCGPMCGSGWAARCASPQAVSAGRIRVAIAPGAARAAWTARAVSRPTVSELRVEWIHEDTGLAKPRCPR